MSPIKSRIRTVPNFPKKGIMFNLFKKNIDEKHSELTKVNSLRGI